MYIKILCEANYFAAQKVYSSKNFVLVQSSLQVATTYLNYIWNYIRVREKTFIDCVYYASISLLVAWLLICRDKTNKAELLELVIDNKKTSHNNNRWCLIEWMFEQEDYA